MPVESDRAAARPSIGELFGTEKRLPEVTREEADAARRHAAEIGDYVMAQRWHWHERLLATQEVRVDRA
jgi:hypothetical protein